MTDRSSEAAAVAEGTGGGSQVRLRGPSARLDPASVALTALIALAVPLLLVGNGVWLLLTSWTIDVQYALPGFPVDREGVQDPHRTELAKTGIRAIRPGSAGVALLQEARLPGGREAFAPREVRHMADVRAVVAGLLTAWGLALAGAAAAAVALRRRSGSVRGALVRGGTLTLVSAGLLGLVMVVDFEWFFEAFHGVFFADGTWRFNDRFTLRQLYPDAFWAIAAAAVATIALLQALTIVLLWSRWGRDRGLGRRFAGRRGRSAGPDAGPAGSA